MKGLFYIILFLLLITPFYSSFADKPYDEWTREDVIEYFESNNIIFEGEYTNSDHNQIILIGRINSTTEKVSMNFFLNSLQATVQHKGFNMISATNDKLGNQYRKYAIGSVELTVVNKKADWPEMYFQP